MKTLNELKKILKKGVSAHNDVREEILITEAGNEFRFKKDEVQEFLDNLFLSYDYRITGEGRFVNAEFECYDSKSDYRLSEFCKVGVVF